MMDFIFAGYMHMIYVLLFAVLIDLAVGEPPARLHPVVWIGTLIGIFKKHIPSSGRKTYGVFMGISCILFASLIAYIVLLVSNQSLVPELVGIVIEAYFLKSTFSIRRLLFAGEEVASSLEVGALEEARKQLSMYVSRDTSKLSDSHVSSAAIETVSENYVDSVLSPLLYYSVAGPFGLIAAYAFKAVSTLDSMVGYRDEAHREVGFFSAKLDDVLNWIPARISLFFIWVAAFFLNILPKNMSFDPSGAYYCSNKDCKVPDSPNSGYPMAAVAGAVGVKLEKPGVYVLGEGLASPGAESIKRANRLVEGAALISIACFSLVIMFLQTFYGNLCNLVKVIL
ncbi:cobalamin biosynthesis protein [Methanohalophilus sp. DAL1]|uniref:cobalamin biosynthesis protein n=1 Tax=Methanohalophilus sp. DAL1 TaxID=1864608 RepID=UPI000817FF72|nr:cobalamin biosynthesis protein [Methanohalophilus sp. DAL1]OBZ35918.1 MAG: cobalamin biosynthesis protein CobD [Methanohalophilus sp. DAL1]